MRIFFTNCLQFSPCIVNWVSWCLLAWFLTFPFPQFQSIVLLSEKVGFFFFNFPPAIAVCIYIYIFLFVIFLCILLYTSFIQFYQNDGSLYTNFESSLLKICDLIMNKHHYFHFYNGQIKENWMLLHCFKAETWEIFLRSASGMLSLSI